MGIPGNQAQEGNSGSGSVLQVGPCMELRMRVMFLPGPVGLREGAGRGMTQPGGLGGSGEEGSEKGKTKAGGFLGPGEE